MPLTRSRERHTCGAQHCCTVPDVSANSKICVLKFKPIKIIRVLQYQPIKTRVKETEKPDSYRRTTHLHTFIFPPGDIADDDIADGDIVLQFFRT